MGGAPQEVGIEIKIQSMTSPHACAALDWTGAGPGQQARRRRRCVARWGSVQAGEFDRISVRKGWKLRFWDSRW